MVDNFDIVKEELYNIEIIASEITDYTKKDPEEVWKNIAHELIEVGYNMNRAVRTYNVEKFIFNDNMIDLYTKSDGFIYESSIESRNPHRISKWMNIVNHITNIDTNLRTRNNKRVLMYGDSVGSDSIFLKQLGYDVYYHDFESYCSRFAEYRFKKRNLEIKRYKKEDLGFDYIICLEVGEHDPNPPKLIEEISKLISPIGLCFFSEAFGLLKDCFPTHLASNLQYDGKTEEMFLDKGMFLIWKDVHNKPFVFSKQKKDSVKKDFSIKNIFSFK